MISRQLRSGIRSGGEIWGIEIVLAGNAHEREKSIPPGVSHRRAHALGRGDIRDWADRPFRRDPFARRMGQNGREAKESSLFVDIRRLDSCDLVPAKALADKVQAARQRGIAEGAVGFAGEGGPDDANERFFRIGQLRLRFSERAGNIADCLTRPVHGRPPS
jgi:hypothetical protein